MLIGLISTFKNINLTLERFIRHPLGMRKLNWLSKTEREREISRRHAKRNYNIIKERTVLRLLILRRIAHQVAENSPSHLRTCQRIIMNLLYLLYDTRFLY